jgi:hypothetical protein
MGTVVPKLATTTRCKIGCSQNCEPSSSDHGNNPQTLHECSDKGDCREFQEGAADMVESSQPHLDDVFEFFSSGQFSKGQGANSVPLRSHLEEFDRKRQTKTGLTAPANFDG